MELSLPPSSRQYGKRISGEAKKDLTWWSKVLLVQLERSIENTRRDIIRAWSDAASTIDLGGYNISPNQGQPEPGAAFLIPIPYSIARGKEHINTQEMRVVEQVLLHWGRNWNGMRLQIHIDNKAVGHGVSHPSIRGESMNTLCRYLLLASEHDFDLEERWVSTRDHALADSLFRLEYKRIADLALQLLHPTCRLQEYGLLTYSNPDCQK